MQWIPRTSPTEPARGALPAGPATPPPRALPVRLVGGRAACFATCLAACLAWLAAVPAAGQFVPPEPGKHVLISEIAGGKSLFGNPAALAFNPTTEAMGVLAIGPEPGETGLRLRQMMLSARAGILGISIRRDSFTPEGAERRQEGSGFMIGVGWGGERWAVGAVNDQYRRGFSASRWEVGGLWRAQPWLNVGAAWQNIGSPVVIGQRAPAQVAGGVTFVAPEGWGSVSAEGTLRSGSLDRTRLLARARLPRNIDAMAALALDGDGEPTRFTLGLGYRFDPVRGFARSTRLVNRPGGDAAEYTLGATLHY